MGIRLDIVAEIVRLLGGCSSEEIETVINQIAQSGDNQTLDLLREAIAARDWHRDNNATFP